MRKYLAFASLTLLAAAASCGGSSNPLSGGPTSDDGGTSYPTDSGTTPGSDAPATTDSPATGGGIKTVFMILMENHSWSTIKNSASAKYINQTLVPMGAHAENYMTPAKNHPSEPNYIWLEAGDNLGITTDDDPGKNHQSTKDHLSTQLDNAGVSWKAYTEAIDGNSCPLTSSGLYGAKHTPQIFFDDVTDSNKSNSAKCIAHVRPYSEFAPDLIAGKVAKYNFITPDLCNDMHGEALGANCQIGLTDMIKRGDDWLSREVPHILASNAYKDGGVLFVLWDEGDEALLSTASDGPIPLIVISNYAKVGYAGTQPYTHSSMLKTIETIFGVPYLRGAQSSNDLSDLFTAFP